MDAKIRIDIVNGVFEVEGSEKFVIEVYKEYKDNFSRQMQQKTINDSLYPPPPAKTKKEHNSSESNSRKRKAPTGSKIPIFVKDLDFLGKGKGSSLKEFIASYIKPNSAMEWNLLFVYYLQKIMIISPFGIDHIYTCYKYLSVKPPNNLYQSLKDTARTKGSINAETIDAITVTMVGENLVDHEMPRKNLLENNN
jgi:hypothetical protein